MPALYYHPKAIGLAGSKLTFSISGTTTLQNVYTDDTLLVAHSNPVVADANGVFAPIYMDPKLPDYRVKYTTSADVLIYQVDDYPSNQNVQQSMRLQSTNPFLFLYDTDGTSGSRKYVIRANGASFEVALVDEAEAVYTTILQFFNGVLYSNQTEVAVTASGQFTGTLTGCTTSPTGTFYWRKVNNLASIWTLSTTNGTSNTTAMTITGVPAAIRPQAQITVACGEVVDNGISVLGAAAIGTGGAITFEIATVSGSKVVPGVFTNSGTKGLETGWCVTYPIA